MKLKVSEVFFSIQGEGASIGVPAIFVRLADCNLDCSWCDTSEIWKSGELKTFDQVLTEEHLKAIDDGAHIVFTGGEPLLQQAKLIQFIRWIIAEKKINPFVEIETNGTIIPNVGLDTMVTQYSVSPKLSNCGHGIDERLRTDVIIYFNGKSNVHWKFVVANESDIVELYNTFGPMLKKRNVYLMPQASTLEELNKISPWLVQKCLDLRLNFGSRLQIQLWNTKIPQ